MKNSDIPLHRLFKAARTATTSDPLAPPESMPPYLKGRILAHWRSNTAIDDFGVMLIGVFRGALVCGAVAMAITFAWSYTTLTQEPENYEDIANYDLRAEGMP